MSIIKKNFFLEYQKKSESFMNKIKISSYNEASDFHSDLYSYILCKYLLYGEIKDITDLTELAELSVAKTVRMTKVNAFKADSSASCEGTTSAMNKKVLLLLDIQKEFNIKFRVDQTADLTDTKKIAQAVFEILNK